MKEKIKIQKGFIQIPLLIAIIVSIITVSVITTGVVLHKQGKLAFLIANIAEVFKGTKKPQTIGTEEVQQKKIADLEQEIKKLEEKQRLSKQEDSVLKIEKCKVEAEIKAKNFIEELIKESIEKCRVEQKEQTRTLFGISLCYTPSKEKQEEKKEKYYNQFYLDCLNQL